MTDEKDRPVRQAKALLDCLEPTAAALINERRALVEHFRTHLLEERYGALFRGEDKLSKLLCLGVEELAALPGPQFDEAVFKSIKELIGSLKALRPGAGGIGYARRLLARLLKLQLQTGAAPPPGAAPPRFWPQYVWLTQQHALCTYKDPDLPVDEQLARARKIIESLHQAEQSPGALQETLGITGAVYKRLWKYDNQKQNLERSLNFYLKGYAVGAPTAAAGADVLLHLAIRPDDARVSTTDDNGYTGINAAFILDQLASLEAREARSSGLASKAAEERRCAARLIRHEIIRTLGEFEEAKPGDFKDAWWFHATIAEALFGLGEYGAAVARLEKGKAGVKAAGREIPHWEFESTIRQLAELAYLQSGARSAAALEGTAPWDALTGFLQSTAPVRSVFMGKVGLGLSGGGFRASLYHIGVLARLAEVDLLRHVEVLSCVSGGSIVGAHYYLKLRKLLESRPDGTITCEGYVRLVEELAEEFLAGVKRNVRTRVLAHLPSNLKMLLLAGYSRTLRVGELYEREIFSRVGDRLRDDKGNEGEEVFTGSLHVPDWLARLFGKKRHKRYLADLRVMPLDRDGQRLTVFAPKLDNWWRESKVPILILNAAVLNTGHTWQFTTTWMGEPPAGIVARIDGNDRLRRMYYREAPLTFDGREGGRRRPWRLVRLGHAVAASACVPGLFEPLAMDELFPGRVVRLVDGGVCDNQGVAGLLDQDCTVLLVSDGSGQSASQDDPSQNPLGVLWRSDNILQARVREAQYRELAARVRSSLLRNLMFVHLKQELEVKPEDWLYCTDPYNPADDELPTEPAGAETSYGFDRELQNGLSAIRTDLDSFNDVEAYALMLSGYRMTERSLGASLPDFSATVCAGTWTFAEVGDGITKNGGARYAFTREIVEVGGSVAFKVWRLKWYLKAVAFAALAALLVSAGLFFYTSSQLPVELSFSVGWIGVTLAQLVGGLLIVGLFTKLGSAPGLGEKFKQAVFWRSTLRSVLIGSVMSVLGWLLALIHLYSFDLLYKCHGSLDRFRKRG